MSMRPFFVLFKRELTAYFLSPGAYLTLFLFLLTTGSLFIFGLNAANNRSMPVSMIEIFFQFTMLFGFVLIFPLLSMRLFSEEFKLGTIEPLMTAPVGDMMVVLSKYLAALTFYAFLWMPTVLYFTLTRWLTGTTIASSSMIYWTSYGLILLMGAAYMAVGIFASSLTSNQVLAAIISFSGISVLFYIGLLTGITSAKLPFFRELISYVSAPEHMNDYFRGIVDTRAIVYYLSIATLMLALTHRSVQYRRWKP